MACSETFKLALYSAYVVSIVLALANPANFNYEHAYELTQGANIVTLLILAYCKGKPGDAFIAALLGVAFTLRTTGAWRGGSRWDSLLVTIGMVIILKDGFYQVLPRGIPHRFFLYLIFSCLVVPVLAALPHLINDPRVEMDVLRQAALLSSQAYASDDKSIYSSTTDTLAISTRVGSDVYIVFRGSLSLENWKTNAKILGDVVPAGWNCASPAPLRTHKGYTDAFNSIADRVTDAVAGHVNSGGVHRLVFCGHSMGGALATMAALFVACKFPALRPHLVCVSIGAPQVGDGNFVAHFNDLVPSSIRVVNPMDPVPRLLNAQLVHVKGYYPVGSLSTNTLFKSHNMGTYIDSLNHSRIVGLVAAFLPAVMAAALIGLYLAWELRHHR